MYSDEVVDGVLPTTFNDDVLSNASDDEEMVVASTKLDPSVTSVNVGSCVAVVDAGLPSKPDDDVL